MRDIIAFVAACSHGGALLESLCAIVAVPFLAWLACRALAPQIKSLRGDPQWQAPLAASAAALPGALFLAIALAGIVAGIGARCLALPGGRLIFSTIVGLSAIAIARAAWRAIRRARSARRLILRSLRPSARLSLAAARCGLPARELDDETPVCALAGIAHPTVLVSRGALRALTDDELLSALHHERAHISRGDQALAAAVAFFADLLPLWSADLVALYRSAREFAADRCALHRTNPETLSSALIVFAKKVRTLAGAAALAGDDKAGLVERVRALLEPRAKPPRNLARGVAVALALSLILLGGFAAPIAQARADACAHVSVVSG